MKRILLGILLIYGFHLSFGQSYELSGIVLDDVSNEYLTGAHVTITNDKLGIQKNTVAGLDGSFLFRSLPKAEYQLQIAFVGYESIKRTILLAQNLEAQYMLKSDAHGIAAVHVQAQYKGTDTEARDMEKKSANVLNVISAKQIELSPDITVANVVQRVSGLSIERNANGDPQYAVVRGMNKRYNNTLVNGIKIPSPDNDNRFVPLDIFPAVFLEKLAVYKSLSADMEADAIGGTIDMVMKSVPAKKHFFEADFQLGANTMSHDGNFVTYNRSEVYRRSPAENFGSDYEAIPSDFSPLMFTPVKRSILPDIFANASYGNRFFANKLGLLLGGSFQNSYRPNHSYFYDPRTNAAASNAINMNELIERRTSTQQQRTAFHAKLDYTINSSHELSFYGGQYLLNEFRVREQYRREDFNTNDNFPAIPVTRITNNYQTISIADLQGKHQLSSQFQVDWHAVYSKAKNELPDDGVFYRSGFWSDAQNGVVNEQPYFQGVKNSRTWERNADQDLSFFLNSSYTPTFFKPLERVKIGGLHRQKTRDNYYIYYNYNAINVLTVVRGEQWQNFADLPWSSFANPWGDGDNSSLVYDANESISAGYISTDWQFGKLAVQAGLRAEYTTQGYAINPLSAETNATDLTKTQRYLNLFPSASLKYALATDNWLKATYYKAISRPGFFEIVPTVRPDGGGDSFYSEEGNADLRPTIAHNVDVRYELFPNALDQILIGAFYKKLIDPIEYGFPQVTSADQTPSISRILPQNFGDAHNIGLELDYTKYIRQFGIRLNYTYTNSTINTGKLVESQELGSPNRYRLVDERRSLQGQSDHIGNIALLFKSIPKKWDAQIVLNYTGERLAVVSPFQGSDQYMRPMTVLDFSVDKGIGKFVLFLKANNLLNTPYKIVINRGLASPESFFPHQEDPYNMANVREDRYGLSFRLGVRYKL